MPLPNKPGGGPPPGSVGPPAAPRNKAPVAAPDTIQTTADTSQVTDVLANDEDNDGDALPVTAVKTGVTTGQVTIAGGN